MMRNPQDMAPEIAVVFASYPETVRQCLQDTRTLIFEVAAEQDVGPLTETLKWGEPAYLTEVTKAGSTIRLGMVKACPAVFFNCQTTIVEQCRTDFGDAFEFSGNRALVLDAAKGAEPRDPLAICLGRALAYHRLKRGNR